MSIRINASVGLIAAASLLLTGIPATAHNGGILIQAQDDKLVMGLDSEQAGEPPQMGARVESSLLRPDLYGQDVPSFLSLASPPSGTQALPEGADIHWDFLPMTIDGATSNLFYWDGVGTTVDDVVFGPVPQSDVSLGIFNVTDPGNPSASVDGSSEIVPGSLLGTTDSTGSGLRLHRHNWFLLDDGDGGVPPTVVPEGIYLISIQLRMDGFQPSDPFFVVPGTFDIVSNSLASVDAAVLWVEQNLDSFFPSADYNLDGIVDETDYDAWRGQYGASGPFPIEGVNADGNRDGVISAADYSVWRDSLNGSVSSETSVAIPEPGSAMLCYVMICYVLFQQVQTRRPR